MRRLADEELDEACPAHAIHADFMPAVAKPDPAEPVGDRLIGGVFFDIVH